jgi:GNAT superfamily N-acetyltransferase
VAVNRFSLVPLSSHDIDSVVALHLAGLPYSLNSKLGSAHLGRLYKIMAEDPDSMVLIARNDGGIMGVVSATLDALSLKGRLMSAVSLTQKILLARRMIFHPSIFGDWFQSQSTDRPVIYKGTVVNPCLTSIVVRSDSRRSGTGKTLVSAVDAFVLEHGKKAYYLDTRADNESSRAFYSRLGFIELEQRGRDIVLLKEVIQ